MEYYPTVQKNEIMNCKYMGRAGNSHSSDISLAPNTNVLLFFSNLCMIVFSIMIHMFIWDRYRNQEIS